MIVYHDNGRIPFFKDCFARSDVRQVPVFRSNVIRRIDEITGHLLRPRSLVYVDPDCPSDDGTIIVFDALVGTEYLRWLAGRHPDKRIILWLWNPLSSWDRFGALPKGIEVWSYSERDCERFGLRFNTSFYFDSVAELADAQPARPWPENPKAFFIGRAKGRRQTIEALGQELEAAGAEVELLFKANRRTKDPEELSIPYPETLDSLKAADILIDIYDDPDAGLSLRPMEAMFWNKKLVTNHARIERCDFFDPANVYLLGHEERTLADFLATPPSPVDATVRDRYLLSNWLKRFDCDGASGDEPVPGMRVEG